MLRIYSAGLRVRHVRGRNLVIEIDVQRVARLNRSVERICPQGKESDPGQNDNSEEPHNKNRR